MRPERTIAVALHDIEPATYERCALIRDWLSDHGIARVTLLVIPARDLHPLQDRRPEMTDWLRDCERAGDAIAQHGFQRSPCVAALLAGSTLRVDLHPADLALTRRMLALEALLHRAARRSAVTNADLAVVRSAGRERGSRSAVQPHERAPGPR